MGLKRFWEILTAPWHLAASLDAYAAAQQALLHDVMGVQRTQAETNLTMATFLEEMVKANMVDGPPEGRSGLDDGEELELLSELQRNNLPPKYGPES